MKATTTIDQAQARAEQAAVEATAEYELEMAFQAIEEELFKLLAYEEEVDEREAMRAAGLHEYQEAAQVRNATTQCQDGTWW